MLDPALTSGVVDLIEQRATALLIVFSGLIVLASAPPGLAAWASRPRIVVVRRDRDR